MALPQSSRITEADYLALERDSALKHEYADGQVYAMTGASEAHNLITGSTYVALYSQIGTRRCNIYPSDMRVKVAAKIMYAYPDLSVVCGPPRFAPDLQPDTLLNPTVVIEILSRSTEAYDRGDKFEYYRGLESLQEYVLISQDRPRIERFLRQDDGGWAFNDAIGLEATLELPSIGCVLALSQVYEKITLGP